MFTRRKFLAVGGAAAAGLSLTACGGNGSGTTAPAAATASPQAPTPAHATLPAGALQTRVIPASGEAIPVIGMGTSGSFEVGETAAERDPLREVLRRFFDAGATVIDTAPTYGTAEDVMGALLADEGLIGKAWLATKLSGVQGREAGLAQFTDTLRRLRTDQVHLLQVHNLGDLKTQMALARELKAEGRVRYVGLTHYLERAHDDLAEAVRAEKPDFLQINYSVVSRGAERRVLPMAQELGIAVMINRAFEDGKLFSQVAGKPLPESLTDTGVGSWAQAFLKFALSHPAVTVVIPATGKPERQSDNLQAGLGPDLTEAQRQALIAAVG